MNPAIRQGFERIKGEYGAQSIERVERMMDPRKVVRDPLQKGAKWLLPGLSQRPWLDLESFPDLDPLVRSLEAAHPAIKNEFARAWEQRAAAFGDYQHYLVKQNDWKAFYFFRVGEPNPDAADAFPRTFALFEEQVLAPARLCPLLETHFSTLLPGAAIAPHCDLWNFSINLHFAVDIPDGCAIRVAGEERTWAEGKCLLFDYSFEHEAWNRSDRPRTCLLFDLWHPGVTPPERKALVLLITEIRKFMGGA